MDNVFSFPSQKIKSNETPINIDNIEELVDEAVQDFIINVIKNIDGINLNLLLNNDYHNHKMIAFLRETMIATIKKLKDEEHGIQSIAYDVIFFSEDENNKELTIELEDV